MAVSQSEPDHFRRPHRGVQDAAEERDESPAAVSMDRADVGDGREELSPLSLVDQDKRVYGIASLRGGSLQSGEWVFGGTPLESRITSQC